MDEHSPSPTDPREAALTGCTTVNSPCAKIHDSLRWVPTLELFDIDCTWPASHTEMEPDLPATRDPETPISAIGVVLTPR